MRNISTELLSYMGTQFGLEPILIVRVSWNGLSFVDYGDKAYSKDILGNGEIQGKLLNLSNIDDVIGIDSGGNSVQVTVTLDDSDGTIKSIINTIDVHNCRVQILQWFPTLSYNQAFVLFTGLINSAMEWSEGERTFTFDVLNKVEDLEVGFSFDEGTIFGLPVAVAGKAIPMVFGNCLMVPSLILGATPSGLLAKGVGIIYDDIFDAELAKLNASIQQANNLSRAQYALGVASAEIAVKYNDGLDDSNDPAYIDATDAFNTMVQQLGLDPNDPSLLKPINFGSPPDDYNTYLQYFNASQQYYAQAEKYKEDAVAIGAQVTALQKQMDDLGNLGASGLYTILHAKSDGTPSGGSTIGSIQIASLNYNFVNPAGQNNIEMNGTYFLTSNPGTSSLTLIQQEAPPNLRPYDPYFTLYVDTESTRNTNSTKITDKSKFKWFDAGTRIRFLDVPIYYAACLGPFSRITGVWAKARGIHVQVPSVYYTLGPASFSNTSGETATIQLITMALPLSSILDAAGQNIYDSDEIWCDIQGEVTGADGANFADIVNYLLAMYSTLNTSPSISTVGGQMFNNPMNFVLTERKPVLELIKELAFQAKTAIWIDDNTVMAQYLSAEPDAVGTITPDDIVEDSLVVTSTSTEDLVTRMVGTWKSMSSQETNNILTLRYNLAKYGLHSEEINYYAFNSADLVQRSLAFWVVRKGTVWKVVKFKTFMDKLNLESHDVIVLSGFEDYFSCQDVKGIVQSAVYDSNSLTIEFSVWLPIQWGQMCQTPYAYPSDQTTFFGDPNNPDFLTGNPFQSVTDNTSVLGTNLQKTYRSTGPQPPLGQTSHFNMQDTSPGATPTTQIAYVPINPIRPANIEKANDKNIFDMKILPPVTITLPTKGNADIGTVLSMLDDPPQTYIVQPQTGGATVKVKQQLISDGFRVANGAVVYIIQQKGKWMMQHPVWSKETAPS